MNHFGLMIDWGLSPSEARVLFCLYGDGVGGVVSIEAVQHAASCGAKRTESLARVHVFRIRQKIEQHGVVIQAVRKHGYMLTKSSLEVIERKLGEAPYRVVHLNNHQQQGV